MKTQQRYFYLVACRPEATLRIQNDIIVTELSTFKPKRPFNVMLLSNAYAMVKRRRAFDREGGTA